MSMFAYVSMNSRVLAAQSLRMLQREQCCCACELTCATVYIMLHSS
jgi:hypothetical protein